MKQQVDVMAGKWNSKLTKCQIESMSSLNDKHMKHQVDEMAGEWNSKLTKCRIEESASS